MNIPTTKLWNHAEDLLLLNNVQSDKSLFEISQIHRRTEFDILTKLKQKENWLIINGVNTDTIFKLYNNGNLLQFSIKDEEDCIDTSVIDKIVDECDDNVRTENIIDKLLKKLK